MSCKIIIVPLFISMLALTTYQEYALFNFNLNNDLSSWLEASDILRPNGESKGAIVIQRTSLIQRAVFFSLLNPNANGGGFAGVKASVSWNLSGYEGFGLNIRGQGENYGYKVVLRDYYTKSLNTYEQFFEARRRFSTVYLPFNGFSAYFKGKPLQNGPRLNNNNIVSFGLQVYGGIFLPFKQKGVSSLEINWIKIYP